MVNVYEAVDSNKRKSALIIVLFIAFILGAAYVIARGMAAYFGYASDGLDFMGIALVVSGVMSFISYYWSDRVVLGLAGARPADRRQDFEFYTVAENMSLAAGMPMPKLYVIDDPAMNAFATGRDPKHASIAATSGLLERLNRTELEGVIGHEMSHVVNYDTRLMSIVVVLVGLITLLGDWFLRASFFGGGRRNRDEGEAGGIFMLLGLVFAILSPIVAQLIQLAISRRREYLADANSVKLTRQPSGLISALQKLGRDQMPLEHANKATAHLYIVNPFKGIHGALDRFSGLFDTHPPLADRIKALEQMS